MGPPPRPGIEMLLIAFAVIVLVASLAALAALASAVLPTDGGRAVGLVMGGALALAVGGGAVTLLVLRWWMPAALASIAVALVVAALWAWLTFGSSAHVASITTPPTPKASTGETLLLPAGVTAWAGGDIPVCWTADPGPANAELVAAVEEAETAWMRVAHVNFRNIGICPAGTSAVRLTASLDGGNPDTAILGSPGTGQTDQVSLAFSFPVRRSCALRGDPVILRACVYGDAVHEFGHVLGLPDVAYSQAAPPDCLLRGDHPKLPIPYDRRSVMNACNDAHYFGRLSDDDIRSARALYGPPAP